jgi:hypothetical protein
MSGGSRVGVELAVSIAPAEHLVEILRTAIGKLGAASPPGHA